MKKARRNLLAIFVLLISIHGAYTLQGDTPVIPTQFVCKEDSEGFIASQLEVGIQNTRIVAVDFPENLLRFPATSAPSVGELGEGTTIEEILAGPACFDSYIWWYVRTAELEGWTPEYNASTASYLIEIGDFTDTDSDGVGDDVDFCPAEGTHGEVDDFGCPTETTTTEIIDTDTDGVEDSLDFCPEAGIPGEVDDFGCPLETPTVEIIDTDSDGVGDDIDFCPEAGIPGEVDDFGCPLETPTVEIIDTDSDGVRDENDFCIDTGGAGEVDDFGCPLSTGEETEIATATEEAQVPADNIVNANVVPGEGDIRFDYYIYGITVINVSEASFPLSSLNFTSETGAFDGSEWNYSPLKAGDCVQLYYSGSVRQEKPSDCNFAQVWIERGNANDVFWQSEFTVSLGEVVIGICEASPNNETDSHVCELKLDQP